MQYLFSFFSTRRLYDVRGLGPNDRKLVRVWTQICDCDTKAKGFARSKPVMLRSVREMT